MHIILSRCRHLLSTAIPGSPDSREAISKITTSWLGCPKGGRVVLVGAFLKVCTHISGAEKLRFDVSFHALQVLPSSIICDSEIFRFKSMSVMGLFTSIETSKRRLVPGSCPLITLGGEKGNSPINSVLRGKTEPVGH